MKIETLTPQIATMYFGQQCNVIYNAQIIGPSIRKIDYDIIYWLESGSIEILPHLRPLSSLTEAEARELYEISRGEKWNYEYNSYAANRDRGMGKIWSCLENWWMGNYEMFAENGDWLIGDPNVWLYLLSKGFDLFGLIEAGLAKEITK